MTDQLDNPGKTDALKSIDPVKIEWNWDLNDQWNNLTSIKGDQEYKIGEEGSIRLKGRCRRCWGGLIAKCQTEHFPEAIRCRVCETMLEGDDAKSEFQRMSKESSSNMFNIAFDQAIRYSDEGRFVQKVFPHIARLSEHELRQRVTSHRNTNNKNGRLNRNGLPVGSAGFLFLQAKALMSGVECLPRETSVVNFLDLDINDDGSATVYLSKEELRMHSKTLENNFMKKLGSTMTISMMSAFACELAIKAICLTCMDHARKSHDLWKLYCDLPKNSTDRIEADFSGIVTILEKARHTFNKWRYFEPNDGGHGFSVMIDTERAFDLAKAARVILDEAEMVGLGYSVAVEATRKVPKADNRKNVHVKHDLKVRGTEAPPK